MFQFIFNVLKLINYYCFFVEDEEEDEDDEWNDMPHKMIGKCIAQYDFEAKRDDELNILSGDEIFIIEKRQDGWWKGKLNDSVGLFPSTYVKELV